jgi:Tol biopolymer transport system component
MRASVALAVIALSGSAVALYIRRPPESSPTVRLALAASGQVTPQIAPAISPDGSRVAFVSTDASGRAMLWIRQLDSQEPRLLAGTEDAAHPFWSPDGRSIGFMAGGKLKRVDAAGGAVLTLSETTTRSGGAWSTTGVILFVLRPGELASVPAAGGPITPVLQGNRLAWPRFLPDGEHFLFVGQYEQNSPGVYAGTLGSKQTKRLMTSTFEAAYSPPGYLLFPRGETLMAQPFDAARLELTGEPALVAEGIWSAAGANHASFSVSQTGVLAYTNASLQDAQLVWFDRTGQPLGVVGPPARISSQTPALSPDEKRVAITRGPNDAQDIWLLDLANAASSRLTLTPRLGALPSLVA